MQYQVYRDNGSCFKQLSQSHNITHLGAVTLSNVKITTGGLPPAAAGFPVRITVSPLSTDLTVAVPWLGKTGRIRFDAAETGSDIVKYWKWMEYLTVFYIYSQNSGFWQTSPDTKTTPVQHLCDDRIALNAHKCTQRTLIGIGITWNRNATYALDVGEVLLTTYSELILDTTFWAIQFAVFEVPIWQRWTPPGRNSKYLVLESYKLKISSKRNVCERIHDQRILYVC